MSAIPREELSRRLRRKFTRFKFEVKTELEWQSKRVWSRVSDVSRNGLFIEMPDPPGVGTRFAAHLALNAPLYLNCVVRRVVPGCGIGVSIAVPEESKKRFDALLTALALGAGPATTGARVPHGESPRAAVKVAAAAASRRS